MPFTIREYDAEGKFSQQVRLEALEGVIPPAAVAYALAATGRRTPRERKLNLTLTLWVVIGLYVFAGSTPARVLAKLAQGVRLLHGAGQYRLPGEAALDYRRRQLGVRPLAYLCRTICQPLADPATPGAFAFGLRLVALDGTVDAVPDTPENVRVFGRALSQHGASAFPQVRGVHLVECGTHALIGSTFWPYTVGERHGAWRLLDRVPAGWLVMWDAGLHDYDLVAAVQARGAQVLARLPSYVQPRVTRVLPDGTRLVWLQPGEAVRRQRGEGLWARWIRYRIADPAWPGAGRTFSLITTLTDPVQYPVREVLAHYHSRWSFELALDEIETHQRLAQTVLRARRPARVLQELYGLVLAHYAVRALMYAAARQAGMPPASSALSKRWKWSAKRCWSSNWFSP